MQGNVLGCMGKTYSIYFKDEELAERVDEVIENGRFHNQAHFFTEAAEKLIEEERDDEMMT